MLGLFFSERGISIIEGEDFRLAPALAVDPHVGRIPHELIATDAVVFNCEERVWFDQDFSVVALYEQRPTPVWQRAVRPEPTECQQSEQRE